MSKTIDYSEATYQFVFLHELVGPLGLTAGDRVIVPTLRSEYKLGYDAELIESTGASLFLQFKRGMERVAYSKEDKKLKLLKPYWEFDIHSQNQHNRLCVLAAKYKTYYCASTFRNTAELYSYVTSRTVVGSSAILDPASAGTVPDDDHRFVFWPATRTWDFFSEGHGGKPRLYDSVVYVTEAMQASLRYRVPLMETVAELQRLLETPELDRRMINAETGIASRIRFAAFAAVAAALRELGITWYLVLGTTLPDKRVRRFGEIIL